MSSCVLRDSTNLKRIQTFENLEAPPAKKSRKHVAPNITLLHEPGECVHKATVAIFKAQCCLQAQWIHFAAIELLNLKTSKVPTDIQAGQSHCGNCECGHWALNPSPRDDKMPKTIQKIESGDQTSPNTQRYLKVRMDIDEEQMEDLLMLPTEEQAHFIRTHLSPDDMLNSFNGTAFSYHLGGTGEGPKEANDWDQAFEKKARLLVDNLCKAIEEGSLDYNAATENAYEHLIELHKTSIQHLVLRIEQIEKYVALEAKIHLIEKAYPSTIETSDATIDDYEKTVCDLLTSRQGLLTRMSLCYNFKLLNFVQISHRQDFFHLKAFAQSMLKLKEPEVRQKAFALHMEKIKKTDFVHNPPGLTKAKIWLEEAQGRLVGLEGIGLCNIRQFDKLLFGIMEKGIRRAPTKQELTLQLIDMTAKQKMPVKTSPKEKNASKDSL